MTREEIKEILEKQLQLLSEASAKSESKEFNGDLAHLTSEMLKTADFLIDLEPIHPERK